MLFDYLEKCSIELKHKKSNLSYHLQKSDAFILSSALFSYAFDFSFSNS